MAAVMDIFSRLLNSIFNTQDKKWSEKLLGVSFTPFLSVGPMMFLPFGPPLKMLCTEHSGWKSHWGLLAQTYSRYTTTDTSHKRQVHHNRHLTQTAGTPPKTPHTNSQSTSMLCSIIPQTVWIGNVDSSVVWVLDHDWKVMCSSPCRSRVKTFFLRVNFLCRVLVWYPFHPPVTAVAHKRFQSFCQKCRWQVTPKYICGFAWTDEVTWHGAQLYGVHRTCWDGRTIKS